MDHIQLVFLWPLVSGIPHWWWNSFKCLAETHITSFLRRRTVSLCSGLEKAKKKGGNRKEVKMVKTPKHQEVRWMPHLKLETRTGLGGGGCRSRVWFFLFFLLSSKEHDTWHPRVQELVPRTSCSTSTKTLCWHFLHGDKTELMRKDKQESRQARSVHK